MNEKQKFQNKILSWYEMNRRMLPWRDLSDDIPVSVRAYHVLVSEIMLQQTQVSRVIPKYDAWIRKFPTVEHLAKATVSDVLRYWMGLGYNRRALYLKKCAEALVELRIKNQRVRKEQKRNDYWPQTEEELMKLPGIGTYTARALLCFAFNKQVAVVDTNVKKVILVEVLKEPQGKREPKEIEEIAAMLLPKGRAKEWNQALMDYASLMLKKEKISIPKQTPFHGSDRYYRAKILKLLLVEKQIPISVLGSKIRADFSEKYAVWLEKIITSLVNDGLVQRKDDALSLSS